MRWSGFSSASTRIGQVRGSARIPASDCRSRARSSRRMAGASGRPTGPPRRTRSRSANRAPDDRRRAGAARRRRPLRRRTAGVRAMSGSEPRGTGIHATAVVYGESGVLILGPSGSGKSALALALLARARDSGLFGALIGDDRVWAATRRRPARRIRRAATGGAHRAARGRSGRRRRTSRRPSIGLVVELSERGRRVAAPAG